MYSETTLSMLDMFDLLDIEFSPSTQRSPSLHYKDSYASPTLSGQESNIQSSASSTPIIPPESKDQFSSMIQRRATELQFMVQQLIITHVPEQNRFSLLSSQKDKTNVTPSQNYNENHELISSQYDYDGIKHIINQSLFYSDICAVPPYFREMYDTAHKDGMLNVGIDAEEFFMH